MEKPPDWFVRELKAFDPDLRIRWSRRLELWVLERRVRRALHPGTIKCDGEDDDVIRARDGYLHVASVPPKGLSPFVFEKLRESDLWANGGWKKVADLMDERDQMEEEAWEKKLNEDIAYASREVYAFMQRRQGERVSNIGLPQ